MPEGNRYRCTIAAAFCAGVLAIGASFPSHAGCEEVEIWLGKSRVERPKIGESPRLSEGHDRRASRSTPLDSAASGEECAPRSNGLASGTGLDREPRHLPTLLEEDWRSVSRLTNDPLPEVHNADDTSYATMQAIFTSELAGRRAGYSSRPDDKQNTKSPRTDGPPAELSPPSVVAVPSQVNVEQSPAAGIPQPTSRPWGYPAPAQVIYQMPPQIIYQMPPQVVYQMPTSMIAPATQGTSTMVMPQNPGQGVITTSNPAVWGRSTQAKQTGSPVVQVSPSVTTPAIAGGGPSRTERFVVVCLLLVAAFLGARGLQWNRLCKAGREIRRWLSSAIPGRTASVSNSASGQVEQSADEALVNRVIAENVNLRQRVASSP